MYQEKLRLYFRQFVATLKKLGGAVDFIYKHRLWEGFWSYRWAARLLIIAAVLMGLKFLSVFLNWLGRADATDPMTMISSMGNLATAFARESYQFIFMGGMKYVLLILLEVIIFHVTRRTLMILTKAEDSAASLQSFIHAQIRMIKIAARSWIMETIATLLIKIFFGIFGFIEFLQPAAIFAVHCYYLGFAVMDNYNEQFGLSIKDSARYARGYIGVALAIGLFLQLAFAIPVAGTIAGPFIAAVAVAHAMYELSDLHLRYERVELDAEEQV